MVKHYKIKRKKENQKANFFSKNLKVFNLFFFKEQNKKERKSE